ncbi:MAG: hypothetical protein ACI9OU_000489 [Candidatus Promineifilaceae bacterium]|jgi:uncharacterized protein YbbK (DUF523 family)/uncharacterized protein YbgA (DUF1722 family)
MIIMEKMRVGISTCLLGAKVRFDGGHKKDAYVMGTLNDYFEWVSVCPEVEVGMSTPRESLRLVGTEDDPRLITNKTGEDWTERMNRYAKKRVAALKTNNLHGYILKSKSPSCGMERVKVYTDKGMPNKNGRGLFAKVLLEQMPYLPVEEEGRLHDHRIRENFIIRVFSHYRWDQMLAQGRVGVKQLVAFHAEHKFLIMAHSETHMRQLGKLVAQGSAQKPADLVKTYGELFFEALTRKATIRRHVNVLEHIAGFFKKEISAEDRAELKGAIEDYRLELVPLIVPMTLIRHHTRTIKDTYISNQVYLNPHPKELMLLNHV